MSKNGKLPSKRAPGVLMEDVARLAGVATSTVSRALANPGRVNEETRERIATAARKLGYTPNAQARNLRLGKSRTVMIILPGTLRANASPVVPDVLHSIDMELLSHGYHALIANVDRDERTEKQILDLAFSGVACGAIVLTFPPPIQGRRSLPKSGIPVVALLADMSDLGFPSVITNDAEAMNAACRMLLSEGHRHFLYVGGPMNNYHEIERRRGVVEAIRSAGLNPDQALTTFHDAYDFASGFKSGTRAAQAWLAMSPRPTAALCYSDDIAITLLSSLGAAGIKVPQELSIVGFDDSSFGEFTFPPLTTIRQPTGLMGAKAAQILIDLIEGKSEVESRTVFDSETIVRGSTRSAPPRP